MKTFLSSLYASANLTDYMCSHAASVPEKVRVFRDYIRYVNGPLLDWGCDHAPDANMVKHVKPDAECHACDVREFIPEPFCFNVEYRQITPNKPLPYADGFFDTVIGAGTFEHVACEALALQELFRVIKPHGTLILTHIPNAFSLAEFLCKVIGRTMHTRKYTQREMRRKLLENGFYPRAVFRYNSVPLNNLFDANQFAAIDRIPVANWFCNTMTIVATRVDYFGSHIVSGTTVDPLI